MYLNASTSSISGFGINHVAHVCIYSLISFLLLLIIREKGLPVEILTPGYRKGFEKRAKRKVIDDFHNSHWFGETIK
jgi:hypothetical protein